MRVTRKIFNRVAANLFFNQFSGDILFSSLVSFVFCGLLFFCLFVWILKLKIYILKLDYFWKLWETRLLFLT